MKDKVPVTYSRVCWKTTSHLRVWQPMVANCLSFVTGRRELANQDLRWWVLVRGQADSEELQVSLVSPSSVGYVAVEQSPQKVPLWSARFLFVSSWQLHYRQRPCSGLSLGPMIAHLGHLPLLPRPHHHPTLGPETCGQPWCEDCCCHP